MSYEQDRAYREQDATEAMIRMRDSAAPVKPKRSPPDPNTTRETELESALRLLLDQVDYTRGACRVNEMVGAVLDEAVIRRVRAVLKNA